MVVSPTRVLRMVVSPTRLAEDLATSGVSRSFLASLAVRYSERVGGACVESAREARGGAGASWGTKRVKEAIGPAKRKETPQLAVAPERLASE